MLAVEQIDVARGRPLQHHVVQPDVRFRIAVELDVVGLLVHHPEAHVLQNRHALRQRNRAAAIPHLQPDAAVGVIGAAMEIRAQRARPPTGSSITLISLTAVSGECASRYPCENASR